MRKQNSPVQHFRLVIQLLVLALVSIGAYRHQILGGGPKGSAPIDALCPFGALETLYKYLAGGEYIQRLFPSNFILLAGAILLMLVVGRYFCGWICAIGTLQELARKAGQKLFRKVEVTVPEKLDKPLRYLKYVVLIWSLWATWKTGLLVIRPYDPYAAYGHMFGNWNEWWAEFSVGIIILLASLLGSIFVDRIFCKYLCPLGAFLALFSKISLFRIQRDEVACLNCKLCSRKCPVNIPVDTIKIVKSAECIGCLSCITTCPTGKIGTADEGKTFLHGTIAGKAVSAGAIALIGIAIYGGIIGVTQLTGIWRSVPPTLAAAVTSSSQLDPANIKGYMTLKDICDTFKVDADKLYAELKFSQEKVPLETKAKEIRNLLGVSEAEFDTQKIRDAVKKLTGFVPKPTEEGEQGHAADKH